MTVPPRPADGGAAADRRQLLVSGALVAAFAATPYWLYSRLRHSPFGEAGPRALAALTRVCDIMLPLTETPGASDAGVPDFVVLALNHGLDGTGPEAGVSSQVPPPGKGGDEPPAGLYLLDRFLDDLDSAADGDFLSGTGDEQAVALGRIDAAAFAPGGEQAAWHRIKDLILTGYYTSEIGASKELRYELVPGRWDGDVPLAPHARGFSSDWTAVAFG